MPELLKTTKHGRGKASHTHIAYVNEDSGQGVTTVDHGHAHIIVYQQEQQSEFQAPVEAAAWFVQESDGHTHELIPYEVAEAKEKETDAEIVEEMATMFFEVDKLEEDSRLRGYESEDFYMNKQWDDKLKKKLASEDRAAITVNKVEQKMDNLCGYQRQNRTDFKFLPMEGGDEAVSDILNHLVKHLTEQCYYPREESNVFEDSAMVGRGLFNVYTDFDRNVQGDIVIERYPWDEGYIGPHRKEDLSDCDLVFKEKWYSERKLKEMYPEKAGQFTEEIKQRPISDTRSEDWDKRLRSTEFIDVTAKKYRLLERQMKIYKRAFVLVNAADNFTFNAEGWAEADINAVRKSIPGFAKIPRVSYKLRITKIVSTLLLEDEILEDEEDFSLIPLYAKKRNDEWWGKIEIGKELNMLINKAYSQFVDIINKVANYGWFYDSETFPDVKEKQKWLKNAAKPGFNQMVNNTGKPPVKAEGVKFPQELVEAIAMFNNDMREVMNINLEFMGQSGQEQSGVAIKQKIAQQLLGNDFLFDNLSFAKKKIGRILVKKIQKLYTPDRIMRIIMHQNARQVANGEKPISLPMREQVDGKEQVNPVPVNDIDPASIMELLEKSDLSKNDVVVSEAPNSPSAMMGNFLMLMDMAGKGLKIPPEAIMEFAPIPQKDKIIKMITEATAMQNAQEDKKYQTELAKTAMAMNAKQGEAVKSERTA